MFKQIAIAAVTAVIASLGTVKFLDGQQGADSAALDQLNLHLSEHASVSTGDAPAFSVTEELGEDAWLRGKARDGSPRPGPADDNKTLADSANSICFLTKVEVTAVDSDADTVSCAITKDDFTGWWQVNAVQAEGTDASVACNARCLVWE